jgi:hypothetical protein
MAPGKHNSIDIWKKITAINKIRGGIAPMFQDMLDRKKRLQNIKIKIDPNAPNPWSTAQREEWKKANEMIAKLPKPMHLPPNFMGPLKTALASGGKLMIK